MKKLTKEEFIKKSAEAHGNKYDYSLVEYINGRSSIKIICPIHGEFEQIAKTHLQGCACPKCASMKQSDNIESLIFNVLFS